MGRAPNLGAPQRVSAHVVPKAASFSTEDEDEKTTIEAGWEEEASTTVEQGDVAEKVRALGVAPLRPNTNITSTNGGSMSDEPTVDDQRASAALAMLPPPVLAHLVITRGNDAGQTLDVRAGKTYTIGRGLDNDLVLTDIAVSRKHFDIRHENGSWVLADRGSGNGTLVNDRIEDAPFMLAGGDVIEIGNTAFRFELPTTIGPVPGQPREVASAPPRPAPLPPPSFRTPVDEDGELSTVSGKPRRELAAAIAQQVTATSSRPKTLPPPAPLPRPRSLSGRQQPVGYALERPGPTAQLVSPAVGPSSSAAALAPTSAPMHGMAALAPQPTQQQSKPLLVGRSPLQPATLLEPPNGPLATTLPGQGPLLLPQPNGHAPRLPFSYPISPELPRQQAPASSRPHLVAAALPRDATSTALVQPMTYATGQPAMLAPVHGSDVPPLSRRAKMVLGGAALALFSAIATIAIIKGATGSGVAAPPSDPASSRPTTQPTAMPPSRELRPAPGEPGKPGKDKRQLPAVPAPAVTPPRTAPSGPAVIAPAAPATTALAPTAATPAPARPPAPAIPDRVAAATNPPAPAVTKAPPAPPPAAVATNPAPPPVASSPAPAVASSPAPAVASPPPAVTSPPAPAVAKTPAATTTTAPTHSAAATTHGERTQAPSSSVVASTAERPDARSDKRKRGDKKSERKSARTSDSDADPADRAETPAASKAERKRSGRSTQDVKNDALALYRAKSFGGAAALVTAALPSFSGDDAKELRSIAAVYSQLGKAYNIGMAPGTKPTDAYVALRRAIDYDREFGSAFSAELQERLVDRAVRAAGSYMAAKEYESAFQAVRTAEGLGSQSSTIKAVRSSLEAAAGDLVKAGASELSSDPDAAKKKLRQVLGMVDSKNPLYVRATKLLNGS